MTANVRKLALDVGFRWLVPLQLLVALVTDYFYLYDDQISSTITAGVMLALQSTTANNKAALWRILPVTDAEIGRARWWQMTGVPGIGIVSMMAAALLLHAGAAAMGLPHLPVRTDPGNILNGLLVQFFYPVFLTAFTLATTFARTQRTPLAYGAMFAVWLPWLLLLPQTIHLPAHTRFLLLGVIGVVGATILYATASRWPLPGAQPTLLEIGGREGGTTARSAAGRDGWLFLWGSGLVRPLVMLVPILAAYIMVILALNVRRVVPMQLQLFIPLVVVNQVSQFNGATLRSLRALPGSAWALTTYLFFLPLALLMAMTTAYSLLLLPWLAPGMPQPLFPALAGMVFASAFALPAMLLLSQTARGIAMAPYAALIALIEFGWDFLPSPWQDERLLAGATVLALGAGFLWMHRQISRGSRVYRLHPFVTARWRGAD